MEVLGTARCYQYVLWYWTSRGEQDWYFLTEVSSLINFLSAGLSPRIPSPLEGVPRLEGKEPQAHHHGWERTCASKRNGGRYVEHSNEYSVLITYPNSSAFKQPPIVQPIQEIVTAQHRYFRIPFMRANAPDNSKCIKWSNGHSVSICISLIFHFS